MNIYIQPPALYGTGDCSGIPILSFSCSDFELSAVSEIAFQSFRSKQFIPGMSLLISEISYGKLYKISNLMIKQQIAVCKSLSTHDLFYVILARYLAQNKINTWERVGIGNN